MNAILIARYPGHAAGNVVKAFTSAEMPPRHDMVEELGSITVMVGEGFRSVFLMSIPDAEVGAAAAAQAKRTAFISARAENFSVEMHYGLDVPSSVPMLLSVLPK